MNKIWLAIFLLASVVYSKDLKKELIGKWELCESRDNGTGNSTHFNVCPTIIFKEKNVGIYFSSTKRIGAFDWKIDSIGYLKIKNKNNLKIIDDDEYSFRQNVVVKGRFKSNQAILKTKNEKFEYILSKVPRKGRK